MVEGISHQKSPSKRIPEFPGIISEGRNLHRDELTMEILEGALAKASPERRESIIRIIIAYAKNLEFDRLTGLSNLNLLRPKFNSLLSRLNYGGKEMRTPLESILVVRLDLNGLKYFNDAYDHSKGDQALVAIAKRLISVLKREGDNAFRLHGDEFLMLFPIDSNSDSAEKLFTRIKDDVNRGLHIEGEEDKLDLLVRASFGHTVVNKGDKRTVDQIIKDADVAERAAKRIIRER